MSIRVTQIMTTDVFTLRENDTLMAARGLMALKRIRHIPIVHNDNTFIGLLTHRDLLAATVSILAEIDEQTQNEIDASIPIREIMNTDVTSISPEATALEAAEVLWHNKYGCLPVTSNGRLQGIITEADFLKLTISLLTEKEN